MDLSGGSDEWPLCDLLSTVEGAVIEGADEGREVGVPADAAEAPVRLVEPGGDPALEHASVAPAADVADEAPDQAVEILDRIGTAQRAVGRAVTPRPCSANVSSSPFRSEAAAPGWGRSRLSATCVSRRWARAASGIA